ncbi:MAG: hypothetical protein A2231_01285 [Candidatus Firestonebacteria bacterium RIFOXYA2_FULL_40_8]|nr:MAG: hypothetical protein A2231_01285 [Candidatus Firestonebacteria bacterium RIFOXYA2_FULL_40_8]
MNKKISLLILLVILISVVIVNKSLIGNVLDKKLRKTRTLESAILEIRPVVEPKMRKLFAGKKCKYPPEEVRLLALKQEKILELWAENSEKWSLIKKYPVLAASGKAGPKLKEGDCQVPEGVYKLVLLNPNSNFHLSVKVEYPNVYDLEKAGKDKRTKLGGDIFIHGSNVSIGCLAMGDEAIEEIFYLIKLTGLKNSGIIIAPCDMRSKKVIIDKTAPSWVNELYQNIRKELDQFK